ncbi:MULTISPECIES: hypothetical protein [unclassified Methylibium]|uniref:hypothetical protein n=1 Tax=unclassified Methylibium TaxID=2633235 RepID=UPI0003F443AB|nr:MULTISPECIES: hypothetical protein [unclassified Methylibium]EWS54795.1 hypothetical protein X551_02395 [Methylibium sp. T29]EWS59092.1 hypothetical protein Y694_03069 [Methylibium sp. T29-B]
MTLKLEGIGAIPDGTPLLMECDGKLGRVYAKMDIKAGASQPAADQSPGSTLG